MSSALALQRSQDIPTSGPGSPRILTCGSRTLQLGEGSAGDTCPRPCAGCPQPPALAWLDLSRTLPGTLLRLSRVACGADAPRGTLTRCPLPSSQLLPEHGGPAAEATALQVALAPPALQNGPLHGWERGGEGNRSCKAGEK